MVSKESKEFETASNCMPRAFLARLVTVTVAMRLSWFRLPFNKLWNSADAKDSDPAWASLARNNVLEVSVSMYMLLFSPVNSSE